MMKDWISARAAFATALMACAFAAQAQTQELTPAQLEAQRQAQAHAQTQAQQAAQVQARTQAQAGRQAQKAVQAQALGKPAIPAMPAASDIKQPFMPSGKDLDAAMRQARDKARSQTSAEAMDQARKRAETALDPAAIARGLPQSAMQDVPMFAPGAPPDPMEVAKQYRQMSGGAGEDERFNLIVFVSLSMPEESLKKLGMDAKRTGALVVLRGMKFGLKEGTWLQSLEAMKPLVDTGANVQVNPELFQQFGIRSVPTIVVSANPVGDKGCGDGSCAAGIGFVTGDVSLEYALDKIGDRKDAVGKIAREKATRLN